MWIQFNFSLIERRIDIAKSWSVFLQAQQVIVLATQFVIDTEMTLKSRLDMSAIWERMLKLESMIEPLVANSDTWTYAPSSAPATDLSELTVARTLRYIAKIKLNRQDPDSSIFTSLLCPLTSSSSARIKLHRYCAFYDVPVFVKKHCDLASASDLQAVSNIQRAPTCGCSSTYHQTTQAIMDLSFSPSSNTNSTSSYTSSVFQSSMSTGCGVLPFSSNFSAKICLRASLNIARAFQKLPFPLQSSSTSSSSNSLPYDAQPYQFASAQSRCPNRGPRMMPLFACCAMQSTYAMVMLSNKTKEKGTTEAGVGEGRIEFAVKRMIKQIEGGLEMVLDAMRNYTVAYEALAGMRGRPARPLHPD